MNLRTVATDTPTDAQLAQVGDVLLAVLARLPKRESAQPASRALSLIRVKRDANSNELSKA